MKRVLLAMTICVTMFVARSYGQHEPPASHSVGEQQAPLLPSNGAEAKEYFLGPAIWTLVIFLIMLAILYPTAWKNVLAGLKKREERIRKDIAEAEAARRKAEETLKQYNTQLAKAEQEVRDIIGRASGEAERIAAGIRTHAQAEA